MPRISAKARLCFTTCMRRCQKPICDGTPPRFALAGALTELGLVQAGIEYYLEVLSGRRSPDLLGKTLGALKPLYERGLIEEWRFLDGVVYGSQYGDLEPDVADFVEYLQALGDLRLASVAGDGRGLRLWRPPIGCMGGAPATCWRWIAWPSATTKRGETAAPDPGQRRGRRPMCAISPVWPWPACSTSAKNYERRGPSTHRFTCPWWKQDVVMLEWAWTVSQRGQPALAGHAGGSGAPIYRRLFAPERDLIRAMALRRLCQYTRGPPGGEGFS